MGVGAGYLTADFFFFYKLNIRTGCWIIFFKGLVGVGVNYLTADFFFDELNIGTDVG